MSDTPTHRELDALLAAAEARAEVRFASMQATLQQIALSLTGENGVIAELKAVKADNRNTRWTILAIFAGSVLAGLAALWTTQANLLAAFQASLAVHPPH
jgi:hypothetical protein